MKKLNKKFMIHLEDYHINMWYAITFNIEENRDTRNIEGQYTRYRYVFSKYLDIFDKYHLWPELSPVGKLHYHGIVQFHKASQILRWVCRGQVLPLMNIKMKYIEDLKGWIEYCRKQVHIMRPFMHRNGRIYKITCKNVNEQDEERE